MPDTVQSRLRVVSSWWARAAFREDVEVLRILTDGIILRQFAMSPTILSCCISQANCLDGITLVDP